MPPLIEVNAAGPAIAYVGGCSIQAMAVEWRPCPNRNRSSLVTVKSGPTRHIRGAPMSAFVYRCRCCGLVVQACRFARVTWLRRGDEEKISTIRYPEGNNSSLLLADVYVVTSQGNWTRQSAMRCRHRRSI